MGIQVGLTSLVYPAWVTELIDALDPGDVRRLASFLVYANAEPDATGFEISAPIAKAANRVQHLADQHAVISAFLLAERAGAYAIASERGDEVKYAEDAEGGE